MSRTAPRISSSLSCLLALCAAACGGTDPIADDVDATGEAPHLSSTGGSATSSAQAKGVAGLFVQEDPTLDTAKTDVQNAQSVQSQVQAALAANCPTGTISLSGTTVTVAFGSNCTVPNLGAITGSVTAAVSKPAAGNVQVVFTFNTVTVSSRTLTGTFTVSTSNGTTFTGSCSLTSGATKLVMPSLTLTLDAGGKGVTLGGSGTVTSSSATTAVTFNAVHHLFGACYADGGSITLAKTTVTKLGKPTTVNETVTFTSTTPTTGQASIQIGTAPATTTKLPAYGTCGA
jgi:hypothetical protein